MFVRCSSLLMMLLALLGASCSGQTEGNSAKDSEGLVEDILADGIVTLAEYRSAVQAGADCIVADGWSVSELYSPNEAFAGDLSVRIEFSVSGHADDTAATVESRQDRIDDCYSAFIDPVEGRYLFSQAPTGKEREEKLAVFLHCMTEAGIENLQPDFTETQFVAAITSTYEFDSEEGMRAFSCVHQHPLLWPETLVLD